MSKWIQITVVSDEGSASDRADGATSRVLKRQLTIASTVAILGVVVFAIWFVGFREIDEPAMVAVDEQPGHALAVTPAPTSSQIKPDGVGSGVSDVARSLPGTDLTLSEDSVQRLASEKRVAIVNDEPITEAMLEREVGIGRVLYPLLRGIAVEDDPQTLDRMRSDLLSSLLDERLLVQAAEKAGISISDEDLNARVDRMLESTQLSLEDLTAQLMAVGVSMDDMRASLRSTMLAEKFVAANPPPEGVRAQSSYAAWVKVLQKEGDVQVLIGDDVAKIAKIGQPAPDFTLRDPQGKPVKLADFAGHPLLVNFWATWCAPCRFEMPLLEETYQKFKGEGFVVLAIDVQEEPAQVTSYTDELGLTFPVALDRGGAVAAAYRVAALPTTIFVDTNGIVTDIHRGALVENTLQGYLDELLGK